MEEHKSRAAPKCATCKHYGRNLNSIRKDPYGYVSIPPPYCYHPNTPVDLVTGCNDTFAADMRRLDGKCGERGAWYEREEPVPIEDPLPVVESVTNTPATVRSTIESQSAYKWWKFWINVSKL